MSEGEWKTRKGRIDPKLDACGWPLLKGGTTPIHRPYRTEEEETDNGPAERYARSVRHSPYNFDGFRAPFLYATNGEVIWFRDVRHPLNRSRKIPYFHTPSALRELLERDFDGSCEKLLALPQQHAGIRPYQKDVNAAVEKAIAERKRHLLLAMATGTGKTLTMVNQIHRLMKSGLAKRVLFLVNRWALAAQAVRAFAAFDVGPTMKFDQEFEVYSSRCQKKRLRRRREPGGLGAARRVFGEKQLDELLQRLNEAVAA